MFYVKHLSCFEHKVSIVVPVHNTGNYLRQCLDSILRQTYGNIEVICVDDGSTDASPAILKEYAAADGRIVLIRQQNKGAGAARNAGMDAASGEYLIFLDSDDFFEPQLVEVALAACVENDADFCVYESDQYLSGDDPGDATGSGDADDPGTVDDSGSAARLGDAVDSGAASELGNAVCSQDAVDSESADDLRTVPVQPARFERLVLPIDRDLLPQTSPFSFDEVEKNAFRVFIGWPWDKCFKRSFLREHGLRFPEIHNTEDLAFVFSAFVYAKRVVVVDELLAHQRVRERGSLSTGRDAHWDDFLYALQLLKDELVARGVFERRRIDFANYAAHYSLWSINHLNEPARKKLFELLKTQAFADLGVTALAKDEFYSKSEYAQYARIMNRDYKAYSLITSVRSSLSATARRFRGKR